MLIAPKSFDKSFLELSFLTNQDVLYRIDRTENVKKKFNSTVRDVWLTVRAVIDGQILMIRTINIFLFSPSFFYLSSNYVYPFFLNSQRFSNYSICERQNVS